MCNTCSSVSLSRRHLLIGSLALAASTALPPQSAIALDTHGAPAIAVSPKEAWDRLMLGNQRFLDNTRRNVDFAAARPTLALGQHPFAAILTCADSRVVPELAFDQAPGDLFVPRVAGNFAGDDEIASLEYAVASLNTRLIVVLGHSRCGAVDAALAVARDNADLPGFLPKLIDNIVPAANKALLSGADDVLAEAVNENIRMTVSNLITRSVVIGAAHREGKLAVLGAHYDLASGEVTPVS